VTGDTAGFADVVDCNNAGGGNISWAWDVFGAVRGGAPVSVTQIQHAAMQELAHTWGLMHVTDRTDLLYPSVSSQPVSFQDRCATLLPDQPAACPQQREQFCDRDHQNSYQEVMRLFGPSVPDMEPPTVAITSPMDGSIIPAKSDLQIIVDAQDDVSISVVELYVNGDLSGMLGAPPYAWNASFPAGDYEAYAIAKDGANTPTTSATIHFTASDGAPPPDPTADAGTGSSTGSTGSTGSMSTTAGPSTSGPDGDSGPGDSDGRDSGDEDEATGSTPLDPTEDGGAGCGCQTPSGLAFGWPGLLALGLGRRRGRRAMVYA
jgi:hypothetical protein